MIKMPSKKIKLNALGVGVRAKIVDNLAQGAVLRRLLELGFVAGASVEIIAIAPRGRTFVVDMMGDYIALSREVCEQILIEK